MNEFKGTPGPWTVRHEKHTGGDCYRIGGSRGESLGGMYGAHREGEEQQYHANTTLVGAAPELLCALAAALQELDTYAWVAHPKGAEGAAYFNVTRAHARATIAKALGEQK